MTDVLTRRELGRATLARQLLLDRADRPVLDTVEHLAGLQAQQPFSPYYQLWSRLRGFVPAALCEPLLDRSLVRIAAQRGTIHLLTAADALALRPWIQPIYLADLSTNTEHAKALVGVDLDAVREAARSFLDEEPRTVAELGRLLAPRWPDVGPSHLAHAARNLLVLVQVPPRALWGRSGQTRLTTVESWLGRSVEGSTAPARFVLRYLAAFGPASVLDVQTWSGLTRLREVVDELRPELRVFRDESGRELFDLPDAPRPPADTPAPVRFLPDFDNVLRSHADRTRVVDDVNRRRMNRRNGVVPHALLVDGEVAGCWRLEGAELTVTPFRPLTPAERDSVVDEGRALVVFATADEDGAGGDDPDVRVAPPE
ncbi:winged helix DNA-binding domain-containing protein [Jiangella asiatica]|uniref:Winged helix DNA-binding domain-containing protein n=1 Tax=Jiangella asiatica TaxID=2530372 RepID=A0A4R5DGE0_9ACTN|nr:winged helix DNA-binding domain-containing protein [Jiangella asiatica]TDE09473.1 winged helix DNA-binding domain-containing protein [Jiangella asiatica]